MAEQSFLVVAIISVNEKQEIELVDFTPNKAAVSTVAAFCLGDLRKYEPEGFLVTDKEVPAPA